MLAQGVVATLTSAKVVERQVPLLLIGLDILHSGHMEDWNLTGKREVTVGAAKVKETL